MRSAKRRLSVASQSDDRDDVEVSKRRPTVYDAVAGRVTRDALKYHIPPAHQAGTYKGQPLRPDEILYKARNAPTRYEETDHYFAHRRLPPDQKLPSGDLLSALGGYISQFFARSEEVVNPKVWRCMDETALIALGILIEESAREISGDTGDLVFTEGVEVEDEEFAKRNAQEQTPTVELRDGGKVTCHSDNEGTASSSDGDGAETDDEDG